MSLCSPSWGNEASGRLREGESNSGRLRERLGRREHHKMRGRQEFPDEHGSRCTRTVTGKHSLKALTIVLFTLILSRDKEYSSMRQRRQIYGIIKTITVIRRGQTRESQSDERFKLYFPLRSRRIPWQRSPPIRATAIVIRPESASKLFG
jgi:hypothetical protein